MPTNVLERDEQRTSVTEQPIVAIGRRAIDRVLIGLGIVATVVFGAAGGLLVWGSSFANDYVTRELTAQHVFFPDEAALTAEGRMDLIGHAGDQVTTGSEAEVYAGYIDGHLAKIGNGKTYADLGPVETAAKAAVTDAQAKGASADAIAKLQASADAVTNQRNTLFKGETLRGLLLSTYAWSTIAQIATIASVVAFVAAAVMAVLVVFGFIHVRQAHAVRDR